MVQHGTWYKMHLKEKGCSWLCLTFFSVVQSLLPATAEPAEDIATQHREVSFFFQCPGWEEELLGQTFLHTTVHKSCGTGSCFASRLA